MEYKLTKTHPTNAKIDFVFNAEEIAEAYDKAYLKASPKVQVNGFRKGKAPLQIVKKVLGDSVAEEAIAILLNESLTNVYQETKISPYSQPKISIEKFDKNSSLVANANIELYPEIKLTEYKNLNLTVYEPQVQEEDIQEHLVNIQYYLAKNQIKEPNEVAEEKDGIELDLTIKNQNGEEIFKKEKLFLTLGRNSENTDFEKNFLGLKAGEEKEFEYTYPETYTEKQLAGKTFFHSSKIHSIYKIILPEINDDLAKEYTDGQEDLNSLKEKIQSNILYHIQTELKNHYFSELIQEIMNNSEYHFPESLIEAETKHQFELDMHKYGIHDSKITFATLAEYMKKSEEEVKNFYKTFAISRLKFIYTIINIAIQEKISISDEEILEDFNLRKSQDPNLKLTPNIKENIFFSLLTAKVESFLIENANKIVEKEKNIKNIRKIISK